MPSYPDVWLRLSVEKTCVHTDHRQISEVQEARTFPKRAILAEKTKSTKIKKTSLFPPFERSISFKEKQRMKYDWVRRVFSVFERKRKNKKNATETPEMMVPSIVIMLLIFRPVVSMQVSDPPCPAIANVKYIETTGCIGSMGFQAVKNRMGSGNKEGCKEFASKELALGIKRAKFLTRAIQFIEMVKKKDGGVSHPASTLRRSLLGRRRSLLGGCQGSSASSNRKKVKISSSYSFGPAQRPRKQKKKKK